MGGEVANLRAVSQSSDKNFKLKSSNFSSVEKTFLVQFYLGLEGHQPTSQPSRILQTLDRCRSWIVFNWLMDSVQTDSRATFCDLLYLKLYFNSYLSSLFFRNKINVVCSVSIFYVCGSGQFLLFLVVHLVGFSQRELRWHEMNFCHTNLMSRPGQDRQGSEHKHLVS